MKPTIPCVPAAERAVIAAILRTNGALMDLAVAGGLTAESFHDADFQRVYTAMLETAKAGGVCDLVTLGQRLPDHAVQLAELFDSLATTVNFEVWVRQLRQAEAARLVRRAALEYADRAATLPPGEIAGGIAGLAEAVGEAGRTQRAGPAEEPVPARLLLRRQRKIDHRPDRAPGTARPFR